MDDLKVTMGFDGDHDEVSRTVSDTLAAEYRDYVTIKRTTPTSVEIFEQQPQHQHHQQQQPLCSTLSSSSTSSLIKDELLSLSDDPIVDDSNYNSRVEFGLKLGYTESQVQMALVKVGPFAAQNELLEELIKLGASGLPSVTKTNSAPIYTTVNSNSANHETHSHYHYNHHHHHHQQQQQQHHHHPDDLHSSDIPHHRPCDNTDCSGNLRPIVIDGCNVAMSHGNKEFFSCRGLRICVDWFKARGHKEITVFVPMWRKEAASIENPIKDREILFQLQNEKVLVFTPSRMVGGRRLTCHDDLYILNLATLNDGIVVSNDNYRDLISKNPEHKRVVEERLLMYSFVNDRFMPPDDPLGRHGPTLDVFLRRKDQPPPPLHCPYGKKCTYGNKCKYYHPERGNLPQKTVTERLLEQAHLHMMEVKARSQSGSSCNSIESVPCTSIGEKIKATHTGSLPPNITLCEGTNSSSNNKVAKKMAITRTKPMLTSHSTSFPLDARLNSSTIQQQSIGSTNSGQLGNNNNNNNNNNIVNVINNNNTGNKQSTGDKEGESVNLHRKLQRQLTLNPTYDARLARMYGGEKVSNKLSRTPEKKGQSPSTQTNTSSGHKQVMRIRSDSGYSFSSNGGGGTSNTLHKKSNIGLHGYSYLGVNTTSHQNITRIASAPDSNSSWLPPRQSSLGNANSDSRLNMCQSISIGGSLNQLQQHQLLKQQVHHQSPSSITAPFPGSSNIWSTTNESIPYQPNWSNSPINLRPLSVPQFLPLSVKKSCPLLTNNNNNNRSQGSQKTLMYRSLSPELFSDNPRSKLYFHLASIFPEKQVRAAMDMLPGETNAQIICAAILNMFTPESIVSNN